MDESFDVIVIGGGASGMMAAGVAASRGKRVLLLEKNAELGKKLGITGGGRCNITNAEQDEKKLLAHYGAAAPFLYSPFSQFGTKATFGFFESIGVPTVVEGNNRAFPRSQSAPSVVQAMDAYLEKGNVTVRTSTPVSEVRTKGGVVSGVVAKGVLYTADSYVLATGGTSHPETGSTGDALGWLATIGHTTIPASPTIVPLKVLEAWIKKLSGKSAPDAKITFWQKSSPGSAKRKRFSRRGTILFTHFGLSGPTILNAAATVSDLLHEGSVEASIDLFPDMDEGILDAQAVQHLEERRNQMLRNALRDLIPPGLSEALLARVHGIDPLDPVHSLRREQRIALVRLLKGIPVTITDLMGLDRAVIADGGVPLEEVDLRTMRSKRASNLFILGDLLHISRPSGGYSLQLCWTTGYVAGMNA